jgi:hypothetical protein
VTHGAVLAVRLERAVEAGAVLASDALCAPRVGEALRVRALGAELAVRGVGLPPAAELAGRDTSLPNLLLCV